MRKTNLYVTYNQNKDGTYNAYVDNTSINVINAKYLYMARTFIRILANEEFDTNYVIKSEIVNYYEDII